MNKETNKSVLILKENSLIQTRTKMICSSFTKPEQMEGSNSMNYKSTFSSFISDSSITSHCLRHIAGGRVLIKTVMFTFNIDAAEFKHLADK